ncbi:maltase 1-like [Thrips palmi]|uniref:alpha-glucosidase n=1 Tax=Thrips palmi TaxID=161013 RepID=A0A6P8ZZC9_THRPL|nr:maltase 1-like [Thrips palmi]
MSEDRETPDGATAGDSLLKPDESKDSVAEVDVSDSRVLAKPDSKVEVKYVNADSQNGDAKIDIENVNVKVFAGMGKEELMRFANDPFWVRTRWILFGLFWLLWLAMLVGAIAIIVLAPRCGKKAQWWERSPLYEVNVRSFKDGSRMADGIGDIQGMRSKLDYIKRDLGVDGVILSSIYPTGSDSSPESVTDFKAIHPNLGTLDEFKELIADMKAKDLRLVLDLVPNHSGKQHKWFQDSIKNISPYKDYYVWSAGKGTNQKNAPPNNWVSVTGGSAWEWNEERNQFYLHQFGTGQPDLNFHNPAVKEEFDGILKYWLGLGVSGFQLRKSAFLVEDDKLQDEKPDSHSRTTHDNYDFYNHKNTKYLYNTFKLVGHWRSLVNNASDENILLVKDEFPLLDFKHDGQPDKSTAAAGDLLQTPDFLQSIPSKIVVTDLSKSIQDAIARTPSHKPAWRLGSESNQRLASKFSSGVAEGLMMVTLLLPGTPIVYYGDEIGLKDINQDVNNRALGPMQWNSSSNAGFTSDAISPWLKGISPAVTNVEAELKAEHSTLKTFRDLVQIRKTMVAVTAGKTNITVLNATRTDGTLANNSILAYTRTKSGNPGVLVAMNPSREELNVDFGHIPGVANELTVHAVTTNFAHKDLQVKSKTQRDAVKLPAESGITFTFVYKGEED